MDCGIANEATRANWEQIFAFVPDVRAEVLRTSVEGETVWSEWEMNGTRNDGTAHQMRGVILFGEPLPLVALIDWLRGRPWAGAPNVKRDDGFDQLAQAAPHAQGKVRVCVEHRWNGFDRSPFIGGKAFKDGGRFVASVTIVGPPVAFLAASESFLVEGCGPGNLASLIGGEVLS